MHAQDENRHVGRVASKAANKGKSGKNAGTHGKVDEDDFGFRTSTDAECIGETGRVAQALAAALEDTLQPCVDDWVIVHDEHHDI